jgi:hypothetical protein
MSQGCSSTLYHSRTETTEQEGSVGGTTSTLDKKIQISNQIWVEAHNTTASRHQFSLGWLIWVVIRKIQHEPAGSVRKE